MDGVHLQPVPRANQVEEHGKGNNHNTLSDEEEARQQPIVRVEDQDDFDHIGESSHSSESEHASDGMLDWKSYQDAEGKARSDAKPKATSFESNLKVARQMLWQRKSDH
jgi:hypothetical protein